SLALEGIDSARQWPTMSGTDDRPRPRPRVNEDSDPSTLDTKPRATTGTAVSTATATATATSTAATSTTTGTTTGTSTGTRTGGTSGSGATTGRSGGTPAQPATTRAKITITKDSTPRKWICKQVPVKTLGGEMMMPIWFSPQ
ncbi:hypothetical protein BGZ94_004038, partial [Podila epigama]